MNEYLKQKIKKYDSELNEYGFGFVSDYMCVCIVDNVSNRYIQIFYDWKEADTWVSGFISGLRNSKK